MHTTQPFSTSSSRTGMKPKKETGFGPVKNTLSPKEIAHYIDHTILKADATRDEIAKLCDEAKTHQFFSVCVNAANVAMAKEFVLGSDVRVCAVVGFPLGATTPQVKAFETHEAVRAGAEEVDMVINVGALKSGDFELVAQDIQAVVDAAHGKLVKVILECALLTPEQITIASSLAKGAGADFVKTSTGFGPGGATTQDVELMRSIVGDDMGVKASGGIRDYDTAMAMIKAGANRLGCSSGVKIVSGEDNSNQSDSTY